ncbi:MAG: AMP-binding protein [Desulfovibrionaceae bacterium]|jgi:acyl-CoA synthetase (AMP-forming)/AMP-acid ligase II|nr:AMP-binding protein [Desulfovibrionaceae bacterium]
MNLFTLLERTARRWPQAGAVFSGTQCLQSWARLHERALRLAGALGAGGDPGDPPRRVAIASENCPEYLELMFGAWAAGAAVAPLNYKLHPREMADIASDAEPSLLFASKTLAPGLRDTLPPAWSKHVVTIGSAEYEALFRSAPALPRDTRPETLAWLFYTSGTTGRSKGAMLTHRNLMASTLSHLADVEAIDEGCSQIHAAPMSHGSGLYIPAYVARGARQVIPASAGFEPGAFLDLCDAHPGCGAFLAPTMVQRLRVTVEAAGRGRPRGLRTIIYGGGPMYVEELNKSLAAFGQVFVQIYGQGESPMTITWLRRADHALGNAALLGSVGTARTGMRVRVVGEDGRDLPAGATGEVICQGDAVMAGYWRNPEATAETLRDGWLHTGDMGSLDEHGYLTLRDRSKDVIISGGSNIYPREVEEALLAHHAVAEACVVGIPDAEWGETVAAFVVTTAGKTVSERELDAHCLNRIARFKRPKRYVFIDALPKNSYGKVLKRVLRERLAIQDT